VAEMWWDYYEERSRVDARVAFLDATMDKTARERERESREISRLSQRERERDPFSFLLLFIIPSFSFFSSFLARAKKA
jgi:hypothetical protein